MFNKLHLEIPALNLNTNECLKLLYDLMNSSFAVDTKLNCKLVQDALGLR